MHFLVSPALHSLFCLAQVPSSQRTQLQSLKHCFTNTSKRVVYVIALHGLTSDTLFEHSMPVRRKLGVRTTSFLTRAGLRTARHGSATIANTAKHAGSVPTAALVTAAIWLCHHGSVNRQVLFS